MYSSLYNFTEKGNAVELEKILSSLENINKANQDGKTALHLAAFYGHASVAALLINAGATVDAVDGLQRTPLISTAIQGHIEAMKLFLKAGADVNFRETDGETAIMKAVRRRNLEAVKVLVEAKADIKIANNRDSLPIIVAAHRGFTDILLELLSHSTSDVNLALLHASKMSRVDTMQALIKLGADINYQGCKSHLGRTPLIWAVEGGRKTSPEAVKLLISANANLNLCDHRGKNAIILAAQKKNDQVVSMLLDAKADVAHVSKRKKTVLCSLARNGKNELVKRVLAEQVDINKTDNDDYSALMLAAKFRKTGALKTLIQHGADINVRDAWGETALGLAAKNCHYNVVKILLDANAEVQDKNGRNALNSMVKCGQIDIVKRLLATGVPVNKGDVYKVTPLMVAARHRRVDIVKLLLEKGANVNLTDSRKKTALHYAIGWPHSTQASKKVVERSYEVLKLLIHANADVNMVDIRGRSALMRAGATGCTAGVKLLLDNNANINAVDVFGNTALICACTHSFSEVHHFPANHLYRYNLPTVVQLLDRGADPGVRNNHQHSAVDWCQNWHNDLVCNRVVSILKFHSASKPESLQDLCRFTVLSRIKSGFDTNKNIDDLDFPEILKLFIKYRYYPGNFVDYDFLTGGVQLE